jgi:hypothetical protein
MFSTPERELTIADIIARVQRGSMRHMRAVLWVATRAHHPEMTHEQCGRLMPSTLAGSLGELVASMSPDPADMQELGVEGGARPMNAQKEKKKRRGAGTGDVFSSMRGAPA